MKKGDFVEVEFKGTVAATGEIFDLTSEEEAKKAGIHNPKQRYGPQLIILGSGMIVPGVEAELEKMNVGEEKEFELKPAQAFGARSPKLTKIISLAKFLEKKINPVPGLFVDIDGRSARIQSVSGGRVRVDFNHPLAGKDLKYKVKIVKHIKTPQEKVESLINYYNIRAEVDVKEKTLTVKLKEMTPKFMKELIEKSLKRWITEIKEVKFQEPPKPEEKPTPIEGEAKV